jgi:hypothetical protein
VHEAFGRNCVHFLSHCARTHFDKCLHLCKSAAIGRSKIINLQATRAASSQPTYCLVSFKTSVFFFLFVFANVCVLNKNCYIFGSVYEVNEYIYIPRILKTHYVLFDLQIVFRDLDLCALSVTLTFRVWWYTMWVLIRLQRPPQVLAFVIVLPWEEQWSCERRNNSVVIAVCIRNMWMWFFFLHSLQVCPPCPSS